MHSKLMGGILLIVGTTIGAGMLALPIATAQFGFIGATLLLIGCWGLMTAAAFLLLEVNLWLPLNSNLISMAKTTLGPGGALIAWLSTLLLLYSLLCAYIAGGSDLLQHLLASRGFKLPTALSACLFTVLFGAVVYLGMRSVDYVNRGLMILKLGSYALALVLLFPFVDAATLSLTYPETASYSAALMVVVTAFGFAIIIPSLRVYFNNDVKQLRKAILMGSLIPLVCYVLWIGVCMGIIPLGTDKGLLAMLHSNHSTSDLVAALSLRVANSTIDGFVNVFTSVCVLTSFLGVSLCLSDFLADGLHVEKKHNGKWLIYGLTFVPPLLIVLMKPSIFITALQYAGIDCVILLLLLPAWMAWRGRYHQGLNPRYPFWSRKSVLVTIVIIGGLMIGQSIMSMF